MNENDILQALADRADEENKEREEKFNEQIKSGKRKGKRRSKSQNAQNEAKSPDSEDLTEEVRDSAKETVSRDTGEMTPVSEPSIPLPEIRTDEKEDPFGTLAEEMSKSGEALSSPPKKEAKEPAPDPKPEEDEEESFEPRMKDIKSKELGERVTKEHAEKLISGEKRKGHRRTVIVHTRVVENGEGDSAAKEEKPAPKKEEKRPPRLTLIREETGEAYDLDQDLTVGRSEDNDIVIPNPEGHYVSSHHAEIRIQGKDIFLKDLESTNGTYVNDRKVGSWRLKAGNIVEFADIKFIVEEA